MKKDIVSFELLKAEHGRTKICTCSPPKYELDVVNRLVFCQNCGAVIDAFDALLQLSKHIDKYTDYQKDALEKIETYREMANREYNRYIKNRVFKEMDKKYQNNLLPVCPKCNKVFEPLNVREYVNRRYISIEDINND